MMTSEVVSLNSSTVKVTEKGKATATPAAHSVSHHQRPRVKPNSGLPATESIAPLRVLQASDLRRVRMVVSLHCLDLIF
jgi:hypothetical protein